MIEAKCDNCGKSFPIEASMHTSHLRRNPDKKTFCSVECKNLAQRKNILSFGKKVIRARRNSRGLPIVTVKCDMCGKEFEKDGYDHKKKMKERPDKAIVCSRKCWAKLSSELASVDLVCASCGKKFKRMVCRHTSSLKSRKITKSNIKSFCSSRCSIVFNYKYMPPRTNRSKPEAFIGDYIKDYYAGTLEIQINTKAIIGLEYNIYVPEFKLAFTLIGASRLRPIYSDKKLESSLNSTQKKIELSKEYGIELHLIDSDVDHEFDEYQVMPAIQEIARIIKKKFIK